MFGDAQDRYGKGRGCGRVGAPGGLPGTQPPQIIRSRVGFPGYLPGDYFYNRVTLPGRLPGCACHVKENGLDALNIV